MNGYRAGAGHGGSFGAWNTAREIADSIGANAYIRARNDRTNYGDEDDEPTEKPLRESVTDRLLTRLDPNKVYTPIEASKIVGATDSACAHSMKRLAEKGLAELSYHGRKGGGRQMLVKVKSSGMGAINLDSQELSAALARWNVPALLAPYEVNGEEHGLS